MFNLVVFNYIIYLITFVSVAELTEFHVIAPQIVCPKHTNVSLAGPDYSIISIEPDDDTEINITWSIRGINLDPPTQRDTLLLWRKIRTLENKLNKSLKLMTFAINSDELVSGVKYIFNITATSVNGKTSKTISMNHFKDQKLGMQRKSNIISALLLSANTTYSDMQFIMEAEITNCDPTLEYYFIWSVYSEKFQHTINVSSTIGSRLEMSPYSLKSGATYEVAYQVVRENTNDVITEVTSSLQVLYRSLEVYLNVDRLIVAVNTPFTVEALVENYDIENTVKYEWQCFNAERGCEFFVHENENIHNFSSGIPLEGEYTIFLIVTVLNESATANATIVTVPLEADLPVLQIQPVHRIINENKEITLIGKAYNVAPFCNLSWYFASEELLKAESDNDFIKYGEAILGSIPTYSIEDMFLDELVDITYETKSFEIEAIVKEAGRACFIADCDCFNDTDCGNKITLYAEVNFKFNKGPKIYNLRIFPESGTALETMFRISSKAKDTDGPLLYSFYCAIGTNRTLLLASYLNHWTLDTFLPYIDGGTKIWMVACDSLGACSRSDTKTIHLLPSRGIYSIDMVLKLIHNHIKRCEVLQFQRVAISAFVSYTNTGQSELAILTESLLESLPGLHSRCLVDSRYLEVLNELAAAGLNTNILFV